MDVAEQVVLGTRLLREDGDPMWVRLRSCLSKRGVDIGSAVLAISFPDDSSFEFGIVVTGDGEVFEYGFDWLRNRVEEGVIREWDRMTDRWRDRPFREYVNAALALRGPSAIVPEPSTRRRARG